MEAVNEEGWPYRQLQNHWRERKSELGGGLGKAREIGQIFRKPAVQRQLTLRRSYSKRVINRLVQLY